MKKSGLWSRRPKVVLWLCVLLCLTLALQHGLLPVNAAGTAGKITIELTDSYGDGWSDNAVGVYADGELVDTVTMDDGASSTWTMDLDPHADYEFRWVKGLYPEETSFLIYIGTAQKVSASGADYAGGDTILSVEKSCSGAKYVNGACSACGAPCPHRYVGADGGCVDCGFVCSGHSWAGGVCTVCSGTCLHEAHKAGACTVCGEKMRLSIEMKDAYSDGWTDNAIKVYADGVLVDTVTLDSGYAETWSVEYVASAAYTFEWVPGSYADECSFRILLVGDVCFEATTVDCGEMAGGVFYSMDPWCDHTYDKNYLCVSCGEPCAHTGIAPEGTCGFCGFTCGTSAGHAWENGACTVCGLTCAHKNWQGSVCGNCGYHCGSDGAHEFDANHKCGVCGFVCGTSASHAWDQGVCGVCGASCAHSGWKNTVCGNCGYVCGADGEHSFDANHKCGTCGFVCGTSAGHAWSNGTCGVCGVSCNHSAYTNGLCTGCGAYQPAVQNGVGENGFALYEIRNAGQLLWFANYVNSNEVLSSKTVKDSDADSSFIYECTSGCVNGKLMADIDMSGLNWTPIGVPHVSYFISRNSYGYAGVFDGNGHTVSGINCEVVTDGNTAYAGFFGAVGGATIRNLTVQGNIRATVSSSYYPAAYVGGIVGYASEWFHYPDTSAQNRKDVYSSIINCTFIGSVSVEAADQEYVGGIAGMASGTSITNCLAAATVSASTEGGFAGSVCGYCINDCTITNCWYDSTLCDRGEVNGGDHEAVTGMSSQCLALGQATSALGFGQKLGVDPYPTYGGAAVYQVTTGCCTYSNTKPASVTEKTHDRGISGCETAAVCVDCGVTLGEATGHDYKAVVTAPTCTQEGYTTHTCANCGKSYTDSKTPAAGHSWNSGSVTTQPTCTANGVKTYTCSACKTTKTESVGATGHTYSNVVTAPTCTAQGYTTHTCSKCSDSYKDAYKDATGHAYSAKVTTAATCTEKGVKTYTCSKCSDSYTEDIKALGHSYTAKVTAPTCTDQGYTTHTCSTCGNSYKDTYTNAKGHSWNSGSVTTQPTCTETGIRTFTCSTCKTTKTETVAAKGHSYSGGKCGGCGDIRPVQIRGSFNNWVDGDMTWGSDGYTFTIKLEAGAYELKVVKDGTWLGNYGTIFNDTSAAINGWEFTEYTDNCHLETTGGQYTFTFKYDTNMLVVTFVHEHSYASKVTAPTCTDQGYTTYTCPCGDSYTGNATAATGHNWVNGACASCGISCDHDWSDGKCTICGSGCDHSYTSKVTTAATCTATGVRTYTCSACDHSYTETIPAAGHSYTAKVTAPTCTAGGYTTHTCSVCSYSYQDSYTDAKGHSYSGVACSACGNVRNFYLWGYINGQDLENRDFQFTNNQYTLITTMDSYVAILSDSGDWYMTSGYPGNYVSSAILYNTKQNIQNADKLFVPKGATVVFTITVNADETIMLSYTISSCSHVQHGTDGKCPACSATVSHSWSNGTCSHCGKVCAHDWSAGKCTVCGISCTHKWNSGVVTTAATCTATGVRTYTCNTCKHTKTESIAAIGHNYTAKVTAPTCTAQGFTTHTCANCSDSYKDTYTEATGHSYTSKVTAAATCTEKGVRTFTCSSCSDSYTQEIAALGHSYTTKVTAPTCTDQGYTTHTCSACGDSYKDTYTNATGHSYSAKITQQATCTDAGVKTFTCATCKYSYTEEIPASGHSYGAVVTKPTCTAQGYTTHTCANCGDSYKDTYTDATGHSWNAGTGKCATCGTGCNHSYSSKVTTAATCTAAGVKTFTCATCKYSYTEAISATGHSYSQEVTEPTCTAGGYTTYNCSFCSHNYKDNFTDATGHNYSASVTKDATCTTAGVKTFTCSKCSDSYTEEIAAKGHSYDAVVTKPTCTAQGYTTHTCANCSDSYKDTYTEATGHNYSASITKDATCTDAGVKTFTCSKCSDSYTEEIAVKGHSYDAVVTKPTCTKGGYTTYTCGACGHSYLDNEVAALGHTPGQPEETILSQPSCEGDGSKQIVVKCEVCGTLVSRTEESIPAVGHSYEESKTVEPTCTKDGYTTHTCSRCGDSYRDTIVSATGHSYAPATCTTPKTCRSCGKISGSALGHSWREATCTEPMTCDACGITTGEAEGHSWKAATCTKPMTCTTCGSTSGEALAHSYEGVVTAPTCTVGGYTTFTCGGCGVSYVGDKVAALGHNYVGGICGNCGESKPVTTPTLKLTGAGLAFKDEILYNIYFTINNPDAVEIVEMGLLTWSSKIDGDITNAENVIVGGVLESSGYKVRSQPIPAKNMGDTLYFKAYVKLADGTYVYSIQRYYSAKLYADTMLADKTASTSIKALCVALMNYGAAAQNKFDYNTGNLMNADLTAEQKALVKDYSADMLADVVMPGNKVGALVDNGALSTKGASVNFGGAFAINYNFVTAHTPDAGVKLYVWDKVALASNEALTLENATQVIDMTAVGNNGYTGRVTGISAKNVEDSYYACAVYTSGNTTYCSGVLPLSVAAYCEAYAAAASDMQALAQATCVYSYYARVHILGA